jgi:hypothetical protein
MFDTTFGQKLTINVKANGDRLVWVQKKWRSAWHGAETRRELNNFLLLNKDMVVSIEPNGWGFTIRKIQKPKPAPQAKPKRLFEPASQTNYLSKGRQMRISRVGNLYVWPDADKGIEYEMIGKVCGSTRTRSGEPCKRWCNSTCTGH